MAALDHGRRSAPAEETDFGFRRVASDQHARLVSAVFGSVAARYDLMNDLMSGGLHRLWKAALLDRLRPRPGMTLIDIAGGTGDVAIGALERVRDKEQAHAIICDASPAMMAVARDRARDRGIVHGLDLVCADAAALPLDSGQADACTIAFGLRNVTRRAGALDEARRILRPGGHFLCLEFSSLVLPLLRPLYDAYSFHVLPWLGGLVTGDAAAYRYLVESIRRFPDQETLAGELRTAGFDRVGYRNLSGGIVALHSAWRI